MQIGHFCPRRFSWLVCYIKLLPFTQYRKSSKNSRLVYYAVFGFFFFEVEIAIGLAMVGYYNAIWCHNSQRFYYACIVYWHLWRYLFLWQSFFFSLSVSDTWWYVYIVILIDLWNVIEGIRENGLNALDPYSIITVPKLESLVTSLYVNLNKRLPLSQQVDVFNCARYLLSWLLIAYDK